MEQNSDNSNRKRSAFYFLLCMGKSLHPTPIHVVSHPAQTVHPYLVPLEKYSFLFGTHEFMNNSEEVAFVNPDGDRMQP